MMRDKPKLLVIDDGTRHVELAHAFLRDYAYATRCDEPGPCWTCPERRGCTRTHAHDAYEADEALAKHPDVDVVLLDVAFDLPEERLLPGEGKLARRKRYQGLAILERLRRKHGALPVVLMTSEDAISDDAHEVVSADELVALAGDASFDARALGALVERTLARRRTLPEGGGFAWGDAAVMATLRRDAEALARTSLPMLVLGETGTGKSALAERVIHPATGRAGRFVAVDLATLPETLVAAELFGAVRGAFSGALDRRGRFEEAHGGTLFLDEIGNLPFEVQRMLLVALQDGRITRLGESSPRAVDVKVVAATNEDLVARVRAGTFRADLLARLNPAAQLRMPPLRERGEDLPMLARALLRRRFAAGADRALVEHYLEAVGAQGNAGMPQVDLALVERSRGARAPAAPARGVLFALDVEGTRRLLRHTFPGNVRELELVLTSAAVLTLSDALDAVDRRRGGRGDDARVLPMSAKLLGSLLEQASLGTSAHSRHVGGRTFDVVPSDGLHAVARSLEIQLYEQLFRETEGDFARMAGELLGDATEAAARKVRLRFNQLGLRARRLR